MSNTYKSITITGRVNADTQSATQNLRGLEADVGAVGKTVSKTNAELKDLENVSSTLTSEADAAILSAQEKWSRLGETMAKLPTELKGSLTDLKNAVRELDLNKLIDLEGQLKLPQSVRSELESIVALGNTASKTGGAPAYAQIFDTAQRPGAQSPGAGGGAPPATPPPPPAPPPPPDDDEPTGRRRSSRSYKNTYDSAERQLDTLQTNLASLQKGSVNESRLKTFRGSVAKIEEGIKLASERAGSERQRRDVGGLEERLAELVSGFDEVAANAPQRRADGESAKDFNFYTSRNRRMRVLGDDLDELDPVTAQRSTLMGMRRRVRDVSRDVAEAGRDGLSSERVDELNDNLEKLTDKLEGNIRAYNETHGASQRIEGPGEPPPTANPLSRTLQDELQRLGGGGLGQMGMFGRLAGRLGPYGLAAGTIVGGLNLTDRFLTSTTRQASDEAIALADLGRQYGDSGESFRYFREGSGLTRDDLLSLGYTGTDAARVAATYDLPARGENRRAFVDDTGDILKLSRSTGLDESRVAQNARTLGLAGVFERGDAGSAAEILKAAVAEGLELGISGSDTMRNLVSFVEAGYREGRSSTSESLAFKASLQRSLAATGSPVMQGDAGAQAQRGVLNALTGGEDPALRFAMHGVVQNLSAADLGMVDDNGQLTGSGRQYDRLRSQSPYRGAEIALEMVEGGRASEVMPQLRSRLLELTGGREDLLFDILKQSGLSTEQTLEFMDSGGGIVAGAVNGRGEMETDISEDKQGMNYRAANAAARNAIDLDRGLVKSVNSLEMFGGALDALTRNKLRMHVWAGLAVPDIGDGADYSGTSGTRSRALNPGQPTPRQREETKGALELTERIMSAPAPQADEQPEQYLDSGGTFVPPPQDVKPRRPARKTPPAPKPEPSVPRPKPQAAEPEAERGLLEPVRNAAFITRRREVLRRAGLAEMAMGPGETVTGEDGTTTTRRGEAYLTTQPGEIYGDDVHSDLRGKQHQGVDIRIGEQGRPDPIYSPFESAQLIKAGQSELGGNYGVFETQSGDRYKFAHLNEDVSDQLGKRYARGDVLATEGMSGAATGYHLHMERYDDEGDEEAKKDNLDPSRFWKRFEDNIGVPQEPTSSTNSTQRVEVHHYGLEDVRIQGLPGAQADQARAGLGEFGRAIVVPESYRGIG